MNLKNPKSFTRMQKKNMTEARNNKKSTLKGKDTKKQSKLSTEEIHMAEQLVKSMTSKWNPKKYHNKSHELLVKWIEHKIKRGKTVTAAVNEPMEKKPRSSPATKGGKVVDFMVLLKKSIDEKKKKPKSHHRK